MTYRKLPNVTREKVLKYFDHRYKGKFFDERAILSEVSSPLRNVSIRCHFYTLDAYHFVYYVLIIIYVINRLLCC